MVINLAMIWAQDTRLFYHAHAMENSKQLGAESLGADYQAAGLDLADDTNITAVEVKRWRQVMESMVLPVGEDDPEAWLLVILFMSLLGNDRLARVAHREDLVAR